MDKLSIINEESLDVLREIANIGAGNATTALATMVDRRIDMSVPKAELVPFSEFCNLLNGVEKCVIGILVDMSGDLNGFMLMILELKDAYSLVHYVLRDNAEPPEVIEPSTFSELEISTLEEMANIIVGSYLSALSSLSGLTITPSIPDLIMDMAGAILSVAAVEYSKIGESVLFLETVIEDESTAISGHFFLIPDLDSYIKLMGSLGVTL